MSDDPQTLLVLLTIGSQIATAVGVVVAIRGHVQRVDQKAEQACKAASRAHDRIDRFQEINSAR